MSDPSNQLAVEQHCLVLLKMVSVLHKIGFEKLRIHPGMSPSGVHWRCSIIPESNTVGESMYNSSPDEAKYSSSQGGRYFDWEDAPADPIALAELFLERFSNICQASYGIDSDYVTWYETMLKFAEKGKFPVAYADWYGDPPSYWAKDGDDELGPPPG